MAIILSKKSIQAATIGVVALSTLSISSNAQAQIDMAQKPVLVITNDAMPASTPAPLYGGGPMRAPEITPDQVASAAFFQGNETVVGNRVSGLNKDLFALQSRVGNLANRLRSIENGGRNLAAAYYANVATINTQLQTGTTPGNPRLVQKLDASQQSLEQLSQNVAGLNGLAVEIADTASVGAFLLETVRSTYNLSGAIEEDHAQLAQMEDQVNNAIITIDRLLNEVNDDITRTTAYLSTERNNLRTLSLAVSSGDLFGRSLANNPFSGAPMSGMQPASYSPSAPAMMPVPPQAMPAPVTSSAGNRPLAKIRFDKPNVEYEQPLYVAVQNALQRYPQARFELIAVHPTNGNAAQVAIESTKARRNAEKVLRNLTQMGLNMNQIDLSYAPMADARSSEVHLYIR
ncbi:MAG: hypothetical protein CMH31_06200 [Micavibrio sp.]|nr:hypothetical protein [Micavibrio sp.]|tara:strand:+ start:24 stop:1232 length:1209 start_codon:yes stop_codon:yes gene_type:complete